MNIRNFVIVAHIDHGKSTLADRFLEITGTVEARAMKAQYLDSMDLERERGITIKMTPVRMEFEGTILNLIDTPGHSDFGYEVSRALLAVEGAILLVDASQGIQAQTLANFHSAKKAGLTIIGAVNKIDLNPPQAGKIIADLALLLEVAPEKIYKVSGKTGEGVPELLRAVIQEVPPPRTYADLTQTSALGQRESESSQRQSAALIFDSFYDDHKGIIAYVRVFGGKFKVGDETKLVMANEKFKIKELGFFRPKLMPANEIVSGEIGYMATGLKDPNTLKIGDTIGDKALPGYQEPKPVVFVAIYPHEDSDYDDLKTALYRLKLNDASFTFEPDMSEVLGRGFKCGFLGRLHFEIITARLEREFNLKTVNSFPSVAYRVKIRGEWREIKNPKDFPDDYEAVMEPMVRLEILTPAGYLGDIMAMQSRYRLTGLGTKNFGDYIIVSADLPLADLISDFDDKLKSISQGYASFSYELSAEAKADLAKLEILVANEIVPGLTRVVVKSEVEREGRNMVEKLKELLPKQQFAQALQAKAGSRIIARENIPALKKDVTGYLYGGDRTRKMKLWKKQARGKERLKKTGRVTLSADVFKELLKK
ncbi:MAG: translation elongation factor 4 [bacterium]|nr:translation elongation factor 4 [bacterium]